VEGSVIRVVLLKKREASGERVEKGLMGVKEIEKKRRRERGGMIKRRGFQSRSENHLEIMGGKVILLGDWFSMLCR